MLFHQILSGDIEGIFEMLSHSKDFILQNLVLLALIYIVWHYLDKIYNKGNNVYPSFIQVCTLNQKLLLTSLTKKIPKFIIKNYTEDIIFDEKLIREFEMTVDRKHIDSFRKVLEVKDPDERKEEREMEQVPIIYPAALMVYPTCCMFGSPEYPFSAIGSVHILNRTLLHREISSTEQLHVKVWAGIGRPVKKGTEIDIFSVLIDTMGQKVWENSSTFLVMHKRPKKRDANGNIIDMSKQTNRSLSISQSSVYGLNSSVMVKSSNFTTENDAMPSELIYESEWDLPKNLGRSYAAVCKDYNVIHVSTLCAKAFGFPSMIIHGLYMASRIGEECKKNMNNNIRYPVEMALNFRRVCVLPSRPIVKIHQHRDANFRKYFMFEVFDKKGKLLQCGKYLCNSPERTIVTEPSDLHKMRSNATVNDNHMKKQQ